MKQLPPTHILAKNFIAVSRGYFDRVAYPSLELAQRSSSHIKKIYSIAGKIIRIHFYGESTAKVLPVSIKHNEIDSAESPDLIIYAWDSVSSQETLVAPWDEQEFKKESEERNPSFFGVYIGGEESLNFYDPVMRIGYFWVQDAVLLLDWIAAAPFRTIFHWFFNNENIHLMHGAVVGTEGKGVLLTARSGSGKSTTALSSVLFGMDYLADDYVAVESKDTIVAHSLYSSAKITKGSRALFPEFVPFIINKSHGEQEKSILLLHDMRPEQVCASIELSAIFIPRIVGGETRIVVATKAEAMLAIAPTTLLQLPLAETKKLGVFKDILKKIPCYFLDLGPDIRGVPAVITSFLENAKIEP